MAGFFFSVYRLSAMSTSQSMSQDQSFQTEDERIEAEGNALRQSCSDVSRKIKEEADVLLTNLDEFCYSISKEEYCEQGELNMVSLVQT